MENYYAVDRPYIKQKTHTPYAVDPTPSAIKTVNIVEILEFERAHSVGEVA